MLSLSIVLWLLWVFIFWSMSHNLRKAQGIIRDFMRASNEFMRTAEEDRTATNINRITAPLGKYGRLLFLNLHLQKTMVIQDQCLYVCREQDQDNLCTICLEQINVGDRLARPSCQHMFHKSCLTQWVQNKTTCPTCVTGLVAVMSSTFASQ